MGIGLNSVDYMRAVWGLTWSLGPADREGGDDAPVLTLHLRNFHRDVGRPIWKVKVNFVNYQDLNYHSINQNLCTI